MIFSRLLAAIGYYFNGRYALTRPTNDIKNFINYYVADEHVTRSLYSIDKAFHPHPQGKRYWQNSVIADESKLVHFAIEFYFSSFAHFIKIRLLQILYDRLN